MVNKKSAATADIISLEPLTGMMVEALFGAYERRVEPAEWLTASLLGSGALAVLNPLDPRLEKVGLWRDGRIAPLGFVSLGGETPLLAVANRNALDSSVADSSQELRHYFQLKTGGRRGALKTIIKHLRKFDGGAEIINDGKRRALAVVRSKDDMLEMKMLCASPEGWLLPCGQGAQKFDLGMTAWRGAEKWRRVQTLNAATRPRYKDD
ncbi:hypothetical protein FACS1894186_1430 [Alphaproteobacteria bacterium]|nr:hypothetical protein FACS1894186_1430 [Alphaproteobacteria bacterium]